MGDNQPPSGSVRLGKLLALARETRGFTQQRVAYLASQHRLAGDQPDEIRRDRVAQWENGLRRIHAADLNRIELALNVQFSGVDRAATSEHHPGYWCEAPTPFDQLVICRSNKTVLATLPAETAELGAA